MSLIKDMKAILQKWRSGVISGQELAASADRIIQQAESVEPVAWTDQSQLDFLKSGRDKNALCYSRNYGDQVPLYTHPPLHRERDASELVEALFYMLDAKQSERINCAKDCRQSLANWESRDE